MMLSKIGANRIEGIGLILILLSFFVQMIETGIENDIRGHENYQIHKKLDDLWTISSHDYSKKYPEANVHFTIDFKDYYDKYKIYSEDFQELNSWQKLVKYEWFTNSRLALFIIGSLLLIIPKFIKPID